MADSITVANPYSVDPSTYISQATAPMQGEMPQFAQMTPANYGGNAYYGPTHQALSQSFQNALQQQVGVPGLLAQMQANPAMAQQVGGLLGNAYTPPAVAPRSLNWNQADAASNISKGTYVVVGHTADGTPIYNVPDAVPTGGIGTSGFGGDFIGGLNGSTGEAGNGTVPITGFDAMGNPVSGTAYPKAPRAPSYDTGASWSCFMAGSPVVMADGTVKPIEDVKIGEYVKGAYGEANKVLAYDRPLLGDRRMFVINGEHRTTDEHTHMRPDRTFGMINLDTWLRNENFTKQEVITDDNGTTEMWRMPGTDDMSVVKQLELGEELWTINGPKEFASVTNEELPPETQLYNLVLDGSHTYFVDGYCVTGFINGRDFDYKTWTNSTSPWTADDYRK